MKRITIETNRLKAIVELYVVCNEPGLAIQKTTDGKKMDIRVFINCDGAHIIIPNLHAYPSPYTEPYPLPPLPMPSLKTKFFGFITTLLRRK
jgi:hypothetical protein